MASIFWHLQYLFYVSFWRFGRGFDSKTQWDYVEISYLRLSNWPRLTLNLNQPELWVVIKYTDTWHAFLCTKPLIWCNRSSCEATVLCYNLGFMRCNQLLPTTMWVTHSTHLSHTSHRSLNIFKTLKGLIGLEVEDNPRLSFLGLVSAYF